MFLVTAKVLDKRMFSLVLIKYGALLLFYHKLKGHFKNLLRYAKKNLKKV